MVPGTVKRSCIRAVLSHMDFLKRRFAGARFSCALTLGALLLVLCARYAASQEDHIALPVSRMSQLLMNRSSKAHPSPIKDGQIIIVRQGEREAAFILGNQKASGSFDLNWFVLTNSAATPNSTRAVVASGTRENVFETNGWAKIEFDVFVVPWSAQSDGKGWIYYGSHPCGPKENWETLMAVTDGYDLKTTRFEQEGLKSQP